MREFSHPMLPIRWAKATRLIDGRRIGGAVEGKWLVERHVNGETLAKEIACFARGRIPRLQTKDCCVHNSANPRQRPSRVAGRIAPSSFQTRVWEESFPFSNRLGKGG